MRRCPYPNHIRHIGFLKPVATTSGPETLTIFSPMGLSSLSSNDVGADSTLHRGFHLLHPQSEASLFTGDEDNGRGNCFCGNGPALRSDPLPAAPSHR